MYTRYLVQRWSEVILCLVTTATGLFFGFTYLVQSQSVFSIAIVFCLVPIFFWWLHTSINRSQHFEKMQDYGTLVFETGYFVHYTYLDRVCTTIEYKCIERIEIIPVSQTHHEPLEETYWVITNTLNEQIQISSLAENAWQLSQILQDNLPGFKASRSLSALMHNGGIGLQVWQRPQQQHPHARVSSIHLVNGSKRSDRGMTA